VVKFGGGYVGAQQAEQGHSLGVEAVKRAGLKSGDVALMLGPFSNENR
jgi:simple sugar transport system substrate-binding protein